MTDRACHTLGILYESDEWSDHKLAHEFSTLGFDVRMLDTQRCDDDEVLACDCLVSRVFASAQFRGHQASLARMPALLAQIDAAGIPLMNPSRAHAFETSKQLATETLDARGIPVPAIFACDTREKLSDSLETLPYPCVIKPDCGGRSTATAIVRNVEEATAFLLRAPDIVYVVEEYVEPTHGFLTRIEIVGGAVALVMKRSVTANGLSGYHHGSSYALYPEVAPAIIEMAERAADELSILFGSFDVIEGAAGPRIIDANSVSNVSPDCTELFGGLDLMHEHAIGIAQLFRSNSVLSLDHG